MVLEKEGKPLLLERKTDSDATTLSRNQSESWKTISHRQRLPAYFNIDNSNQNALFNAVVKYTTKLHNKATRGAKLTKEELTFLSRNRFGLLQLSVGLDVEVNTNKRKVLICTDSYGKNRAWNINEDKDT